MPVIFWCVRIEQVDKLDLCIDSLQKYNSAWCVLKGWYFFVYSIVHKNNVIPLKIITDRILLYWFRIKVYPILKQKSPQILSNCGSTTAHLFSLTKKKYFQHKSSIKRSHRKRYHIRKKVKLVIKIAHHHYVEIFANNVQKMRITRKILSKKINFSAWTRYFQNKGLPNLMINYTFFSKFIISHCIIKQERSIIYCAQSEQPTHYLQNFSLFSIFFSFFYLNERRLK